MEKSENLDNAIYVFYVFLKWYFKKRKKSRFLDFEKKTLKTYSRTMCMAEDASPIRRYMSPSFDQMKTEQSPGIQEFFHTLDCVAINHRSQSHHGQGSVPLSLSWKSKTHQECVAVWLNSSSASRHLLLLLLPRKSAKFRELLRKFELIHYTSPRSSKVIDLGASRKRMCDLLLVISNNFLRISYRFP